MSNGPGSGGTGFGGSAPRHILMTTGTSTAMWTFSVELCGVLAQHGVAVTLMTLGDLPDEAQLADIRRLDTVDLVPTAFRTEVMTDCQDDLARSGEVLLRLEQSAAPDAIHLNNYWHAGLPFRAPVLLAAQSSMTAWWRACRATPLPDERAPYERWVAEAVQRVNMLVAPTAAFLSEFQALHGTAANARAIPNGRSPAGFKPGVKRRIVLATGAAWDEAMNLPLLCRAADMVDVPIVVAGDLVGPGGAIVEANGVAALGRLSATEMARWMAEAAIFAAPARYDSSGFGVLEAALSGCALILSDIPTLRELWDGVATFIAPDDLAGLRRAIRMLSEMPQLAASDGCKARERALTYSPQRMGELYIRAYQDMMASAAGAVAA